MSQLAIRAALEIALQKMVGIVAASTIVSFDGSTFTTSAPHKLVTEMDVKIVGNTGLNGGYFVVVLSPTTFALRDKALSTVVKGSPGVGGTVTPQLTAWENVSFVALNAVPFQKVNFMFARPDDITMGDAFYRERGVMQLTLYYPLQKGPVAAMSRAELIRKTYPRGASFSNNGVVVNIDRTAEILPGIPTDENYIVIVRIPFYANIFP